MKYEVFFPYSVEPEWTYKRFGALQKRLDRMVDDFGFDWCMVTLVRDDDTVEASHLIRFKREDKRRGWSCLKGLPAPDGSAVFSSFTQKLFIKDIP